MKVVMTEVHLLEKGDRVLTTRGTGVVVEDELPREIFRTVKVKLDPGHSVHSGEDTIVFCREAVTEEIEEPSNAQD